jgi:hypothetical protein
MSLSSTLLGESVGNVADVPAEVGQGDRACAFLPPRISRILLRPDSLLEISNQKIHAIGFKNLYSFTGI